MKRLLPLALLIVAAMPPQDPSIAADNNGFALDLYAQLRAKDGNLFFSPYSVSTALAMTYAGARGATAEEMRKVLHFRLEDAKLHEAFAAQIRELNGDAKGRGYALSVANALWGQQDYRFKEEFTALLEKNYGAGMNLVDFAGATEEARRTINAWVEKKTQDKIKELLKPGILTSYTRLVLTNAIYFKGDWAAKFDKKATAKAPFSLSDGKAVDVDMMYQRATFGYADDGKVQALSLPYKGKELSMLILLPRDTAGLKAMEEGLTAKTLGEWVARLREHEVCVWLPGFKMTCEFALNKVLSDMGMPSAFDPDAADFSGMSTQPGRLFISAVVHKAFVEVNEEGTEAAAATAVVMSADSEPMEFQFRADRPFVFAIRHEKTGAILFMGRVANPRG